MSYSHAQGSTPALSVIGCVLGLDIPDGNEGLDLRLTTCKAALAGSAPAGRDARVAEPGTGDDPEVLEWYMPNKTKPDPRPLFTPSTLPESGVPDPLVTFIEDALLAIANRQDEEKIPEPSDSPGDGIPVNHP